MFANEGGLSAGVVVDESVDVVSVEVVVDVSVDVVSVEVVVDVSVVVSVEVESVASHVNPVLSNEPLADHPAVASSAKTMQ
jgi:hypothetical protein